MDDQAATPAFSDDDLVYVDPDARTVVGRVEFDLKGNPKKRPIPERELDEKEKGGRRRKSGPSYYPWGTYRSMKSMYRLEGKQRKEVPTATLDQVMEKALSEPFWD